LEASVARLGPLLACAWLWLVASAAQAQSGAERPSLNWVRGAGAESCASPGVLAAQVEEWLGPVFVPPAHATLTVEGQVLHTREAFEARITMSRGEGKLLGERHLRVEGADCTALKLQAAFVIAVTLDPSATLDALSPEVEAMLAQTEDPGELLKQELLARESPEEPEVDPLRDREPEPSIADPAAVTQPTPSTPLPPRWARIRFGRIHAGAVFGALPVGAATLGASQLWAWKLLGFDVSLGGILPSKITTRWEASGVERSFVAGAIRLRTGLCHRPLGQRVWLFSCLSTSGSWYVASQDTGKPVRRDPLSAFNWGGYVVLGTRLARGAGVALEAEIESNPRGVYFRSTPENDYAVDAGSRSPIRAALSLSGVFEF